MEYKETVKVLEEFARGVVKEAKKNLSKIKKTSGKLKKSIKSDTKVSKNSLEINFEMEDYGKYVDAGVDGKKKKYGKRKFDLQTYKYTTKMPPPKSLDKWIVKKGLAPRDKGRFKGRSIKTVGFKNSISFLIARSIFMKGLEPTYFFASAFAKAYKKLPKEFIDKYELDIDTFLHHTLTK
tara:strand:+ start:3923 stop:4462 length:540 start_codon:yes stop_codon:yes gene_type:complete